MNASRLILASVSPRRAELLRQLNVDFQALASDAPELHHEHLTASELSQINAYRKARFVAKRFPDAVVLGADTLVYLEGVPFGKPRDLAEAQRMLETLQGRTHEVVTGVCLMHLRAHRQSVFREVTDVTFWSLTPERIAEYLKTINPLDKAGGYAIQENGHVLVREIVGSYSNVVGLPLERLQAELARW